MEEVIDFDKWLADYTPPTIEYVAAFDPKDGTVLSVGPSYAFQDNPNTLPMDNDTATMIIEGKIPMHNCFVDIVSNTVELSEIKNVFKIDDVLHRIIDREHADFDKPDVYITYDKMQKMLKFELTEEYNGTYIQDEKFQPIKKKKVRWDGETKMDFLITDYNDPNVLYQMITIKLSDIINNFKVIENVEAPEKFSLYTRRIFKNYLIDIK